MKPDRPFEKTFRLLIEVCVAGPGLLAILVLLSWICDVWRIGALGREYIPMAPSTAGLMLLLSCGFLLHHFRPSLPVTQGITFGAVFTSGGMGLLVLAQYFLGFDLPVEQWLAPTTTVRVGEIPIGRMSPMTASTFLSVALAFWFELPPLAGRRVFRQTATVLALSVLVFSLFVLLSYGAGAPLLYGGQTIPMALITAMAFALLSLGILIAAGTDTWPLSLLGEDPTSPSPPPASRYLRGPLIVFLLLFMAIGGAGFFYLKVQLAEIRGVRQQELNAVADLKVRQISGWYQERLADAGYFFESLGTSDAVKAFTADSSDLKAKNRLLRLMTAARKNLYYRRILLFDRTRKVRLAVPEDKSSVDPRDYDHVTQALHTGRIRISDLHLDSLESDHNNMNMDLFVPLITDPNDTDRPQGPVGVLMLEINPHDFLYPLIQTWPTPSPTAETLLVRREGNEVIFLNELRHRKNTTLSLRFPIDPRSRLPAAKAVMGREGLVEGLDYRNVPVLAALRSIPGTPWFMVAKVDQEEIYAPLWERAWITGLTIFIALLAGALGLTLLWRQHDNQLLRKQLAIEQERNVLAERVLYLNKQANDIILLMDRDWRILEANDRALQAYGYTLEELQGLSEPDLVQPEVLNDFDRQIRKIETEDGFILETVHQRKDRSLFPVESSVRGIEIGGGKFYQSIIRDITERKQVEEELRESEERYRSLFENMLEGFAHCRMLFVDGMPLDFVYLDVNDKFEELTGLKNVVGKKVTEVIPGIKAANPQLFEIYGRVAQTGTPERFEIYLEPLGIWLSIAAYSPKKNHFVAVFDNVTERKQAEAEICRLNVDLERRVIERTIQLEAANKELESFSYSVSHDLRAPLRAIDGFSRALLEDYGLTLDEKGRNYLDRVRVATQRMGQLIDDLLKLSRVTQAEMIRRPVNLSRMAEVLARELEMVQPERRVEWVIAPNVTAHGDERLLEVALKNLLDNAWKFTGRKPSGRIEFGVRQQEGAPVYFVRDDGAGFDMAYSSKLFGTFQRLHSRDEFEGTGVGLAIVRRIIHRHGGSVWAEGAVDRGAAFYFTLERSPKVDEDQHGQASGSI